MSCGRRKAFTLVELLVVIAITGILIAMLLPAVQAARESARKAHCKSNLKQIGLALHNYEGTHSKFPPGYVYIADPAGNRSGFGWAALILPFMEQQALYDQIEFCLPTNAPKNQLPCGTHLAIHICPSDPNSADDFVEFGDPPSERFAMGNYVGNFGSPDLDFTPDLSDGVFSRNSNHKATDIRDGLSNTFFVGERVNGVRLEGQTVIHIATGNTAMHSHHGGQDGHTHFETAWVGCVRDLDDPLDDHGHMVLFHTASPPNSPQVDDRDITGPHSGVAHFLMGDGSVDGVSETVDFGVYQALATRAGGEAVAAP